MNKQRLFVLIASGVGLISCFLPWYSYSYSFDFFNTGNRISSSYNGLRSTGILAFIGFIGAGVMTFLGNKANPMAKTFWFITLGCGAQALLGVLLFFVINSGGYGNSGFCFGIFFALLAAAGVVTFAFIFKNPGDSLKGGFDSLKGDIEEKIKS